MADEIIGLLRDTKFREGVTRVVKEVHETAAKTHWYARDDEEFRRKTEADDWRIAWYEHGYQHCPMGGVEEAFEEGILPKLKKPYRILPAELAKGFLELCGVDPDQVHIHDIDFDLIYEVFVDRLSNHLLTPRQSDGFPVCRLPESAPEDRRFWLMMRGAIVVWKNLEPEKNWECSASELSDEEEQCLLWQHNAVTLCVLGHGPQPSEEGSCLYGFQGGPLLYAAVRGPMTLWAIRAVRRDLERVVPSVLRSLAFLQAKADEHTGMPEYPGVIGLPEIAEPSLQTKKPLLAACLDAYYTDATRKDSMDRRIRNAVHLLVESDGQSSDAIGLSLSMSAIEALLGEHTQELTEKLALNVAVLLEPDLASRQDAVDCVKELYRLRSKARSWRTDRNRTGHSRKGRHLAAAVLDQVVSRRDFRRKAGYEAETPPDLLKDLRDSRFGPGQQGIEETNALSLWRGRSGG